MDNATTDHEHDWQELGHCAHTVKGAVHTYIEYKCPGCRQYGRKGPVSFACGSRIKAIPLSAENCLSLADIAAQGGTVTVVK